MRSSYNSIMNICVGEIIQKKILVIFYNLTVVCDVFYSLIDTGKIINGLFINSSRE